jgi:glycosyltransferase involved in cell wall biosynthesis
MEQSKTEKRKILHLSPFFDNSCGVGTVANSLVKQLKKHGHDVDTIEYRPWRDEKKYMYNSKDSTEYFESSKELTEFLKLKEKDYDVLHFHNQIFSNNQNEELFRYFKDKPKLTQVHCVIPYDNKVLKQKSLHNLEELSRQARMINRSDKVVHLTDEVKEIAMKYYGNEHPKDVEVIHNSANQPIKNKNQIKKLRKKLSKNNEKLILYAGRLSEEKGIIELSEGFQKAKEKNPNLKLIICGENRFNEEMNNTIKEKMGKLVEGKDYVFEGRVKQSELANYYSACDLFIQPSRYEHFSVSAIEAFSHKIPVIMSKMDSIKDTFKMDSKDSYVIPIEEINSVEKISEAIIKADSTSKDDLEKIANKAYDFYKTSLTPEKIALQFENAYEDLINKKSLTPSFEESYVIPIGPNDSKENIQETVDSILKKGGDLSNIILTHYDGSIRKNDNIKFRKRDYKT